METLSRRSLRHGTCAQTGKACPLWGRLALALCGLCGLEGARKRAELQVGGTHGDGQLDLVVVDGRPLLPRKPGSRDLEKPCGECEWEWQDVCSTPTAKQAMYDVVYLQRYEIICSGPRANVMCFSHPGVGDRFGLQQISSPCSQLPKKLWTRWGPGRLEHLGWLQQSPVCVRPIIIIHRRARHSDKLVCMFDHDFPRPWLASCATQHDGN